MCIKVSVLVSLDTGGEDDLEHINILQNFETYVGVPSRRGTHRYMGAGGGGAGEDDDEEEEEESIAALIAQVWSPILSVMLFLILFIRQSMFLYN